MAGKLRSREFKVYLNSKEEEFNIVRPSFKVGNKADRYYKKAFADAIRDGIPTTFQFQEELKDNEYHEKTNAKIKEIDKKIEDLTSKLDDHGDEKTEEGKVIVDEIFELRGERLIESIKVNSVLDNTAESYAESIRNQFYASELTTKKDGSKVWIDFDSFLNEESEILAQTAISQVMLFNAKIANNYQMEFPENKWRLARGLINEDGDIVEPEKPEKKEGEDTEKDTEAASGVIKEEDTQPEVKEKEKAPAAKARKKGASKKKSVLAK
jgi:hypothetical protein